MDKDVTYSYPLQWPEHIPQNDKPQRARFKTTRKKAEDGLAMELRNLGAINFVISTNLRVKLNKRPHGRQGRVDDPAVAVYFDLNGRSMVFACDAWDTLEDNLQALRLTIGALRGIERWCAQDMMQRAFSGFIALPAPKQWREILGVGQDASWGDVKTAYRLLARKHHPDVSGNDEKMKEITRAMREAEDELGR